MKSLEYFKSEYASNKEEPDKVTVSPNATIKVFDTCAVMKEHNVATLPYGLKEMSDDGKQSREITFSYDEDSDSNTSVYYMLFCDEMSYEEVLEVVYNKFKEDIFQADAPVPDDYEEHYYDYNIRYVLNDTVISVENGEFVECTEEEDGQMKRVPSSMRVVVVIPYNITFERK